MNIALKTVSMSKPCIMYEICSSASFNWSEKMTTSYIHISLNIFVHLHY